MPETNSPTGPAGIFRCREFRLVVWAVFSCLSLWFSNRTEAALPAPPLRGNLGAHDPGSIIKCKDKYYPVLHGSGYFLEIVGG